MEFVREKIKEKPISKRRIVMRVGIAALCGLAFALVACLVLVIAVPYILPEQNTEVAGTTEDTQQEEMTQETESQNVGIMFPPDMNLTISDYETLQDELFQIGNQANKSIVTVMKMESAEDWTVNDYEAEGNGSGLIVSEDNNYLYILIPLNIPHSYFLLFLNNISQYS